MSKEIKYEWADVVPSIDFVPSLAYPQKRVRLIDKRFRVMDKKFQIYNAVWDMGIEEGVSRKVTNKILIAIEDGLLDRDMVILACLKYMSEDEVADMAHANEFFHDEEDEA